MANDQKGRDALKDKFKAGARPTETDFKEWINSTFNQIDDGVRKATGEALEIDAVGEEQTLIKFYDPDANPKWEIHQNPVAPGNPSTFYQGFNIKDYAGNSRFFIDENTGNIGFGTNQPGSLLQVQGIGPQLAEFRQSQSSGESASVKIRGSRNSAKENVASIELANYDNNLNGGTDFVMGSIIGGRANSDNESGYLEFKTNDGTGVQTRMSLDKNGNGNLEVEGIIKMKMNAPNPLFALGALESYQVIMGSVKHDGKKLSGKGFTSGKASMPYYQDPLTSLWLSKEVLMVTFDQPFTSEPIIVVSMVDISSFDNLTDDTGLYNSVKDDNFLNVGKNKSQFVVISNDLKDDGGTSLENESFDFIAIGPV